MALQNRLFAFNISQLLSRTHSKYMTKTMEVESCFFVVVFFGLFVCFALKIIPLMKGRKSNIMRKAKGLFCEQIRTNQYEERTEGREAIWFIYETEWGIWWKVYIQLYIAAELALLLKWLKHDLNINHVLAFWREQLIAKYDKRQKSYSHPTVSNLMLMISYPEQPGIAILS